ncbi:hypothetical protein J2S46_000114 [Kitasatospora herbaricolor]|nr:hypothetical protein [Kitasatospora herbaricolor]
MLPDWLIMNAEHRRPLYGPFSEPAAAPVLADGGLAVERAPVLEPASDDVAAPAVAPGGRRRLVSEALAGPAGSEG